MDNGGTVGGGQDTSIAEQFTVTVSSNLVNHAPSINTIATPPAIPANSGLQTVNLTGLGIGAGDSGQLLTITASSDNTGAHQQPDGHLYQPQHHRHAHVSPRCPTRLAPPTSPSP